MILELSDIHKFYKQGDKKINVLNGLNFKIDQGEKFSIIGRSGSGKSTLLSIISGILKPDQGKVLFKGNDITGLDQNQMAKLRGHEISLIFQQFHLLKHLNALENVSLALEIKGEADYEEKAKFFLNEVGLSDRIDHFPGQLSGGEQQRVAIARSLATNPSLLLADEPSGSLDEQTGNAIMDLLFDLSQKNNTTLVLVTHSLGLAKSCEKVFELHNGELKEQS